MIQNTTTTRYDVIAVNKDTRKVEVMAENKTLGNTEVAVMMAVSRRGVDTDFFAVVEAGTFRDGDTYSAKD